MTATEVQAEAAPPRRRSFRPGKLPGWFRSNRILAIASVFGGLALWEFVATAIVKDSLFLVGPRQIASRFTEMLRTGELTEHVLVSGQEFGLGLLLSVVLGVSLGLLVAIWRPAQVVLQPWISALYATPVVALSPLFILWFGIGLQGKVVVVFLMGLFPVLVNTQAGVTATDRDHIEMARAYGLSGLQLFRRVHLRSALPFCLAGVRLAIGRGLVGVVVAELFGARAGLGYLITLSNQAYDMAALFVAVAILAIAGIALTAAAQILENRAAPWRDQ